MQRGPDCRCSKNPSYVDVLSGRISPEYDPVIGSLQISLLPQYRLAGIVNHLTLVSWAYFLNIEDQNLHFEPWPEIS